MPLMRKGVRVEGKGRVLISPFAICCLSPWLPYGQVPLHTPCIFLYVCLWLAPDPYTGNSVPWLVAILPQYLHYLPNCSPFPPLLWLVPLPLVSPAPIPNDQDFSSLALTAWKVATVNNTDSVLCSICFHKCPGSLRFKVLGGCGRRVGVSPPPSLSFQLLKQRMGIFMLTKIASLNACLHLLNSVLIIAAAAQQAAPQNP